MFAMAKTGFCFRFCFWFYLGNYMNCFGNHSLLLQSYWTLKPAQGKEGMGRGWTRAEMMQLQIALKHYDVHTYWIILLFTNSYFKLYCEQTVLFPLLPRAAPRATGTRANDSCGISDMYLLRWLLPGKEFSIFPLGCQKEYWKHFSVLYNFK